MLTNSLGHIQVTVVDGTTLTGLFAADGSLNVFDATAVSGYVGMYHPCGAVNCVSVDGNTLTGVQAPNGALYMVNNPTQIGLYNSCGAFNVSGLINLSSSQVFLNTWGPEGMVMDFTDASISINDAANLLDFDSIGQVSNGSLVGPGAQLTYSAPSVKLTEQSDGVLWFQAHNLCLWSEDFSNTTWTKLNVTATAETVTLGAGTVAKYVSQAITLNAPTVWSIEARAGTHGFIQLTDNSVGNLFANFNLNNGTVGTVGALVTASIESLAGGWYRCTMTYGGSTHGAQKRIYAIDNATSAQVSSTSAVGTFDLRRSHVRVTPSQPDYIRTTSAAAFDLPYVWSSGVRGLHPIEPASTNLSRSSRDLTSAFWGALSINRAVDATGTDGITNSATSISLTAAGGYVQNVTNSLAANTTHTVSAYVRRRSGTGGIYFTPDFLFGTAALGTETLAVTERATNGEFTTDLSGWTTTLGGTSTVVWSSGAAVFTRAGGNCRLNQTISGLTRGKTYLIEINISSISGGATIGVGRNASGGCIFNTTGVKRALVYTPDTTAILLVLAVLADGSVTVDYVSVKEVTNSQELLTPGSSTWTRVTRTLRTGEVAQSVSTTFAPELTGDVFEIDHVQLESGTIATSPIITYGGTGFRAVDNLFINTNQFPYSATQVLMFAEMVTPVGDFAFGSTACALTNVGVSGNGPSAMLQASGAAFGTNAGWSANAVTRTWGTAPTNGSVQRFAGCFNTVGTLAAATNQGQTPATSSASLWNGSQSNRLQIGAFNSFGNGTSRAIIRRLMILPEYNTTKIQGVTA